MELSSLKLPRPVAPKLSAGDRRVQGFLRDLEKIKSTNRHRKKLKRSEMLINRIAQCLRKLKPDHLLYTTAVWTLISIFRMLPDHSKQIMLNAGIPAILSAVMHSGALSGSMRQYASELCFYLSSNEPYPQASSQPAAGPLPVLPVINVVDRYQEHMDEISLPSERSDISSFVNDQRNLRFPFKAYRINAENMRKLEGLFNDGYDEELAKSLPHPGKLSNFGFDHRDARIDESESDSDYSDKVPVDDDDESINSTISSGSHSQVTASVVSSSNRSSNERRSKTSDQYYFPRVSNFGFGSTPPRKPSTSGAMLSSIEATTLTDSSFMKHEMSSYLSRSMGANDVGGLKRRSDQLLGMAGVEDDEAVMYPPHYRPGTMNAVRAKASTFRIGSNPVVYEADEEQHDILGDPFPLQQQTQSQRAQTAATVPEYFSPSRPRRRTEEEEAFYAEDTLSTVLGSKYPDSNWKGGERKQMAFPKQEPFLQRSIVQQQLKLSPRHNESFYDNDDQTPLQPMSNITGGFGTNLIGGRSKIQQQHSLLSPRLMNQHSSSLRSDSGGNSRYPDLYDRVHPRRRRNRLSTAPAQLQEPDDDSHKVMGGEVTELLAQLDPLSLNVAVGMKSGAGLTGSPVFRSKTSPGKIRRGVKFDEASSAASSSIYDQQRSIFDDDDEEDDDELSHLEESVESQIEADAAIGRRNPFLIRKRQRIRAEKLVDHTFIKQLFARNATTAQAQNLLTRMESLLHLMDPDRTGFVSWECFTRLVLSVAPSHLLRADVVAFMQAQTDNDQDLIDYNEFIISGKVVVIDKAARSNKQDFMPIEGWLMRQKTFTGEASTLTWKNHVKWYQARKSKAIVWLMRRAARSMKHAVVLEEAENFLLKQRKRAMALAELMEIGFTAANTQDVGNDARKKLLQRCMHARRWATRVDAAQKWLANAASVELEAWARRIKQEEDENDPDSEYNRKLEEERIAALPRKKQADYATFYRLYQYTNLAVQWLTARGRRAIIHVEQQDEAQDELQVMAKTQLMQMLFVEEAANWLRLTGEHAYNYCIHRDDVMKYLFRIGQKALKYLIRQEEALEWLMRMGKRSVAFMSAKTDTRKELLILGMRTLKRLNDREDAFAFLVAKRHRAERLLKRRAEAEIFLRRQPYGVWDQQDRRMEVQEWLAWRGNAAVNHINRQHKALLSLQYTAGRATIVQRRHDRAFTDLLQFGQEAKLDNFLLICQRNAKLMNRLREETKRVVQLDKQERQRREKLHKIEKWKADLREAFDFLALCTTPPAYQSNNEKKLIGRIGFNRLLMDGALLGISHEHTYEYFKSVDPATSCFVPFDVIWSWFLRHAQSHEASLQQHPQQVSQQVFENAAVALGNKGAIGSTVASISSKLIGTPARVGSPSKRTRSRDGGFTFTTPQIVSAQRRALYTVLKRVNSEITGFDSDFDWDAMRMNRRRRREDDSSSEEESDYDEFEGMDEDELFANLEFLRRVDIGRLMRYLTKKKMQKQAMAVAQALAAAEEADERVKNAVQSDGTDGQGATKEEAQAAAEAMSSKPIASDATAEEAK